MKCYLYFFLVPIIFLSGCVANKYIAPADGQPQATIKLNQSYSILREDDTSETYDERLIMQSFIGESSSNCKSPGMLGFSEVSGYAEEAKVKAGEVFNLYVLSGYAYDAQAVRFSQIAGAYKEYYSCGVRAKFIPKAGRTYIATLNDGLNKTCNLSIIDSETSQPAENVVFEKGYTTVSNALKCSK